MKKKICFGLPLLTFFIVGQFFLVAQNSGPSGFESSLNTDFEETFDQQNLRDSLFVWQENIVLQLNKNVVERKDNVFFKAYVLTGPEKIRVSASDVLKMELLGSDGKLISSQYHKIVDGTSSGTFEIPKRTKPGEYYLRAYTKWMLNYGPDKFAIKKIQVSKSNDLNEVVVSGPENIKFFPEGGGLISGLTNMVAMTGIPSNADKIGIVNVQGQQVAAVTKYGESMGTAIFTPVKNQSYFLVTNNGQKVALPKTRDLGFTIRLNNLNVENSHIRIGASPELTNEKIYLKGTSNGVAYFETEVDFDSKTEVDIEIPKTGVPSGILQLSVVDEFGQVWAERPVFIENNELTIQMSPMETSSEGESYMLRVTDSKGLPVETTLSVGIASLNAQNKDNDIYSINNLRSQRFIKDLKAMTHQSFDGAFYTSSGDDLPSEIYYEFQNGLEFYGQAYNLDNSLLSNTKIQLLITTEDNTVAREATTDDNGMFKISNLQLEGEANMVFRTVAEESKEKLVRVIPFEYEVPPLTESENSRQERLTYKKSLTGNKSDLIKKEEVDKLIALEGVTLKEKKIIKRSMPPVYGIKARQGRVAIQDPERPRLISELLLGIPGVFITGDINYPTIALSSSNRNNSSNSFGSSTLDQPGPLWVIDGFTIENSYVFRSEWGITANDIDRIEYIAPYNSDTSMWGSRAGTYGVFLVYTRNGSEWDYYNRKEAQLTFKGFQKPIDFDTYQNELPARKKENSEAIYWNPALKTNKNGEVIVRFQSNEKSDKLKINAIAVTQDGDVGKLNKVF